MIKLNEITSYITGLIGLAMIRECLGIIILILSILNILFNMCVRIYQHVKNKNYDQIDDELNNTIEQLSHLKGGDDDE